MFGPCVIPKHHKQKPPDVETGENRSFPRQLQRGVEQTLRWCKSTSAEQPTKYTRHTAMTQVLNRSWKKISHKEVLDLSNDQITVNREKTLNKNSPSIDVRLMCYSQTSQAKNTRCRQERTGHFDVNSKEEWNIIHDGVNHRGQSNRQNTQDWRQWHKTSIEAGKISHKEVLDLTNDQKTVNREKTLNKNSPSIYVRPMCYSQTSQAKNTRCRDRREQVISTSTPKRSGTWFTMVWIIEWKATDSLHKTGGNDTRLPSKQKKISQGSIVLYNSPKHL